MKNEIELYELIEKYLGGTLTAEEKFAFEIRLSSDPEFEQTVEKHRHIYELIEEGTLLEIRDNIRKIHHKSNDGGKSFLSKNGILLLSAIIIISGLFIMLQQMHKTEQQGPAAQETISPVQDSIPSPQIQDKENMQNAADPEPDNMGTVSERKDAGDREISSKHEILKDSRPQSEQNTEIEKETESKDVPDVLILIEDTIPPDIKPEPHSESKSQVPTKTESVNCDTVYIHADIIAKASCEERATGKILVTITATQGASAPFTVSVDDARNFQEKDEIADLPSGMYPVWMKDKNNCLSKIGDFLVGSITCDYEFIFAPDKGEQWDVPSNEKSGVLKIHSKQGILIYSSFLVEGIRYRWDGTSTDGTPQPMGVYRFIIEFEDGEPLMGNVTIVR